LLNLSSQICSRSYWHGSYKTKVIYEKKRRNISVAEVRDRVVHRLVYDYLVQIYDKSFDFDVYSSRKEKGLHKALSRTQFFLKSYYNCFVWRADISKFFENVDRSALLNTLEIKLEVDSLAMYLCCEIINSCKPKSGIPIGNLTSQVLSNIYLNEFDRFVRLSLKPKAYLRYGDDFILFARTKQEAENFRKVGTDFLLTKLKLSVNFKNDIIVPAKHGLKFLGHNITDERIEVDRHTNKLSLAKVNYQNIASYKAMYFRKEIKNEMEWKVLDEILDFLE
jgi:retron-type reverse transcriptase